MADTITETIMKRIVTALDGAGKPAGLTVNRSRKRPKSISEMPMISVYAIEESVKRATENRTSPLVVRDLRVRIVRRAKGTDDNLDVLRAWSVKAVMADMSLGGITLGIDEVANQWDADDATDQEYSADASEFIVWYRTSRFDLEKATA
jgi:hypothetical protein